MAKLSTSEVQAILKGEKSDALSAAESSKLSHDRGRALDYYLGDMSEDMPAPADRSRAVSSDVADTVEGLMPSLMEVFFGGDEVVEFVPTGQEDEEAAQQETDYVNYVFTQKNNGFLVMYSFVKDALLSKNGIVKVYLGRQGRGIRGDALGPARRGLRLAAAGEGHQDHRAHAAAGHSWAAADGRGSVLMGKRKRLEEADSLIHDLLKMTTDLTKRIAEQKVYIDDLEKENAELGALAAQEMRSSILPRLRSRRKAKH